MYKASCHSWEIHYTFLTDVVFSRPYVTKVNQGTVIGYYSHSDGNTSVLAFCCVTIFCCWSKFVSKKKKKKNVIILLLCRTSGQILLNHIPIISETSSKTIFFVIMWFLLSRNEHPIQMSHGMTKPTKWVCAQRRHRSAWASAQSDQSLRRALNG